MDFCLKDVQGNVQNPGEMPQTSQGLPWLGTPLIKSAPETRRNNKPLMEKRRRARINQSVALLKNILLASRQDLLSEKPQKQSKLEKADILEMTVRHFQMTRAFGKDDVDKYRFGFTDCVKEVERFFNTPDIHTRILPELADLDIKIKLLRHLESCVSEIESKKTSPSTSTQVDDDGEEDIFVHKSSDIDDLNAFQEEMTKELIRNMSGQKQREKENVNAKDKNEPDFIVNSDNTGVKEEPLETITHTQESINHQSETSQSSRHQVYSASPFQVSAFQDGPMISMMPSGNIQGQVLFLLPTNVFGINNTTHFFTPFVSQMPEEDRSFTTSAECDMYGATTSTHGRSVEELNENMYKRPRRENPTYELTNSSMGSDDTDEPLDFSMNSDSTHSDPMWRPW